jgi:hypothetical protein
MYETAKQLIDAAMTAHAEMFGISRETELLDSQRGRDGGVNAATEISFPLDGLNRGKLPVYVWF